MLARRGPQSAQCSPSLGWNSQAARALQDPAIRKRVCLRSCKKLQQSACAFSSLFNRPSAACDLALEVQLTAGTPSLTIIASTFAINVEPLCSRSFRATRGLRGSSASLYPHSSTDGAGCVFGSFGQTLAESRVCDVTGHCQFTCLRASSRARQGGVKTAAAPQNLS